MPVEAFQVLVMPLASEKLRVSSELVKLAEICMEADSILLSSGSVIVREESMTLAPSFSV